MVVFVIGCILSNLTKFLQQRFLLLKLALTFFLLR